MIDQRVTQSQQKRTDAKPGFGLTCELNR